MGPGTKGSKTTQDLRTRDRLLQVAAEMFADRGFKKVTIREISAAAQANVAAVNYHFGDKDALYRAVVQRAIEVMRETNDCRSRRAAALHPRRNCAPTSGCSCPA